MKSSPTDQSGPFLEDLSNLCWQIVGALNRTRFLIVILAASIVILFYMFYYKILKQDTYLDFISN